MFVSSVLHRVVQNRQSVTEMLIKVDLLLCGIFATVGSCFGQYANSTTSENRALAHIARKLVHAANWTVLGTIAPIPEIKGFPMVNLVPMSDGPPNGRSSGYIYFHLSKSNIVVESIQVGRNFFYWVYVDTVTRRPYALSYV